MLTWKGDKTVANYEVTGGNYPGTEPAFMFDGDDMTRWSNTDEQINKGSVIVNFHEKIQFTKLSIKARKDGNPTTLDRYKGVCLYIDGRAVSCTPPEFVPAPGETIEFAKTIDGQRIELKFSKSTYAQIPELWINYRTMPEDGGKLD